MLKFAGKSYYCGLALLAGTLLLNVAVLNAAEQKTLTGTITDAKCGVKHKMSGVSAAECTNKCIGMGSKYGLVVGDTMYELDGKTDELKDFAGEKVTVTGTVDGEKIQVESVTKS